MRHGKKTDAKFEAEEFTCRFKPDMRNLTNFELSNQKSQIGVRKFPRKLWK